MTPRSCGLLALLLLALCPTAAQAATSHVRHHEDHSADEAAQYDGETPADDEGDLPEDWWAEYGYSDDDGDDDDGDDESYDDEAYDDGDYDDDESDDAIGDYGDGFDPAQAPAPVIERPRLPTIPKPVQPSLIHLRSNGRVWVSPKVPRRVRRVIAAADRIAKRPYRYGGGHGSFYDRAYDCSGSVSFALHGAGLLNSTLVSGDFAHWGAKGKGKWITIYANRGHVYMVVAGMRFDTSARARTGTRWDLWTRPSRGFAVRHPPGL